MSEANRTGRLSLAPRPVALVLGALVLAAGTYAAVLVLPGARSDAPAPVAPEALVEAPATTWLDATAADLERVDTAIATWSANLERDGADFIAATHLGGLYLNRGRLSGDADDLSRALDAADRALAANPGMVAGRALRAEALLASHDFAGAETEAEALLLDAPGLAQALAVLGDARVELGDYRGAADAYAQLDAATHGPAVTARQARLLSLTGFLSRARELAADAIAAVDAEPTATAADRSWYRAFAASLAVQGGDLAAARGAYADALAATPGSPATLAGMAGIMAADGDLDGAIELYRQALAGRPDADSHASLGDVLALAGRADEASREYDLARAAAQSEIDAGFGSRALVQFLADHGLDTALAVDLASADVAARPDAHGWDIYAWALFVDGQLEAADEAMRTARAFGTEDHHFDYHAGMIAAALDRPAEARRLLAAALDTGLTVDPLQAERARALLRELGASR